MNIIVSACLLGVGCKYSGTDNRDERVIRLSQKHTLIPVCPEQLGGLETPRAPSEIRCGRVINTKGEDVTKQYVRGAEETLKLAQFFGAECAVLKEKSPSCGTNFIYDGSFSKTLVPGNGITAQLLRKNGITLYSEEDTHELLL